MQTRSAICLIGLLAATPFAHSACDDAAYRQFDFWIGEWDIHGPNGKLAGTNRITREYGGCVIHERYTTERGYTGESLNTYDAGRKVWHQTWVDSDGLLLLIEGHATAKGMLLIGETVGADGKVTKHRIEWTANADGTLRQFWQSTDATGAWITAFDGRYVRRKSTGGPATEKRQQ